MITLPDTLEITDEMLSSLRNGRAVSLAIAGKGIGPAINGESDTLQLSSAPSTLRRGDVVLYKKGAQHVLHRVLRVKGEQLAVRGDACRIKERVRRADVEALLTQIIRADGTTISCKGSHWHRLSRQALRRSALRQWKGWCFSQKRLRSLSPWYFVCLALLMWMPLGGLGVQLNNFVLGIRMDHLLHASVYFPCSWFIMGIRGMRRGRLLLLAYCVAMLTEGVQYFLPYRGFDINDLIANFLGITCGWLFTYRHRR